MSNKKLEGLGVYIGRNAIYDGFMVCLTFMPFFISKNSFSQIVVAFLEINE